MVALIVCGGFVFVFCVCLHFVSNNLCSPSVAITLIGVARSAVCDCGIS